MFGKMPRRGRALLFCVWQKPGQSRVPAQERQGSLPGMWPQAGLLADAWCLRLTIRRIGNAFFVPWTQVHQDFCAKNQLVDNHVKLFFFLRCQDIKYFIVPAQSDRKRAGVELFPFFRERELDAATVAVAAFTPDQPAL